jgi:glycosyltransferase involved in cell wall biosynthesis
MTPLRVLIVTSLYPRPGLETFAPFHRLLFGALAEEHEVTVLAPIPWTAGPRALAASPAWSRDGDGPWVARPRSYYTPGMLRRYYGHMYAMSIRKTFARLVRRARPDVVLASWAHPDGWAAVRLARRAGLPAFVMVIGTDVLVASRSPARRARIAEALRGADGVFAVSRDLAGHVERLGVDPARIEVLHTGVDPTIFHPGDRAEARHRIGLDGRGRVVLYVGNLLESKGAGVLIDALALLKDRDDAARGYLVGGGRDEAGLRSRAAAGGLDRDDISFVGRKGHAELADWYRAADVIALPSDSEGIPNVLREATACGRPWVATRVGGIPEIADPAVDRLVPPRDPAALADAIAATLASPPSPADSPTRVPCPTWRDSARRLAERLREGVRR